MQLKQPNARMLYSRVQTILQRRRKPKQSLDISAPFDVKQEPVSLPGISQDEITMLREKAAASRIGVLEAKARSPSPQKTPGPSRPAVVAVLPPHAVTSPQTVW